MLEQLSILENNRELRDNGLIKRYVMLEFYDHLKHRNDCTLEEIKIELENDIRDYDGNTTLHKLTRTRAEIFLLFIDKIRQTCPRLTAKSLATELVEIIDNLKDISEFYEE